MSAMAARAADVAVELHRAVLVIASQCDGARDNDGVGFAGPDAAFGNVCARTPPEAWNPEMAHAVHVLLRKYRRQLQAAGVDYDDLPVPPTAGDGRSKKGKVRVIDSAGGWFVVRFGYDPEMVDLVRRLPGRRYDSATKTWEVPAVGAAAVRAFAEQHGFGWTDSARRLANLDAPAEVEGCTIAVRPQSGTGARVEAADGEIAVRFPRYDAEGVAAVKNIIGRRWDAAGSRWLIPLFARDAVMETAERLGWAVDPTLTSVPPVAIDRVGVDLLVRFVGGEALTAAITAMPGATWSPKQTGWLVPVESALDLVAAIGDRPTDWHVDRDGVMATAEHAQRMIELSGAHDDPDFVMPAGVNPDLVLRGFQKAAITYVGFERRSFISLDMGLGKTLTSMIAAQKYGCSRVVGIIPVSLRANWRNEIRKFLPGKRVVALAGNPDDKLCDRVAGLLADPGQSDGLFAYTDDGSDPGFGPYDLKKPSHVHRVTDALTRADYVLVNYDVLRAFEPEPTEENPEPEPVPAGWVKVLAAWQPDAILADEAQALKNPRALRTRAAVCLDRHAGDGMRLFLTGTPVMNRRLELAAQLDGMGRLDDFGSAAQVGQMPDVNRRLRARGALFRVKKTDVLDQLPEREYVAVTVEGDPAVLAEYQRAEHDLLTYLAEKAAAKARELGEDPRAAAVQARMRASAAEQLIAVGVLKRLAAKAKLPAAKEWIGEFLNGEGKLLVFAHHLDVLHQLAEPWGAPVIEGAVDPEERQRIVERFQNDPECRVLFLGMQAGGVGLTLTAAHDCLFVEQAWSPATHDQATDRAYGRLNDLHGVKAWMMEVDGTIEQAIVRLLADKRLEIDDATDGDPADREAATSILSDLIGELTQRALDGQGGFVPGAAAVEASSPR